MFKNIYSIAFCVLVTLGSSIPVRADDDTQRKSNSKQSKPIGWEDPKTSPTPSADSHDRSRERQSALEERVRYLEEQAVALTRDLDIERRHRTELEASAETAKREAEDLKSKLRVDQQKVRKFTTDAQEQDPQRPVKSLRNASYENKNGSRGSFVLPSTLRPIGF